MDGFVEFLTVIGAVGSGLVSGIMLAFSVSVMPGLRSRPATEGIAAMQAINKVILNPIFGLVFMGTTLTNAVLVLIAGFSDEPKIALRIAGGLLFLIGSFGITMAVNVPLNEKLAKQDPTAISGVSFWNSYVPRWLIFNHIRAGLGAAATLLLVIALT